MKRLLPIMLLCFCLSSCRKENRGAYEQLMRIDTLLVHELTDSAWLEIQLVDTSAMSDKVRAYYQLLRVQTMWKAYIPVTSDSLLRFPLAYYQQHGPDELLARTYYYSGAIQKALGATAEAVENLKQAELLAEQTGDLLLQSKVYNSLEDVNFSAGDYATALQYALKAVDCCQQVDNPKLLIEDYEALAVAYHHVGKRDSALYYFEQCLPLIAHVRKEEQAHVLANLGVCYKNLGSEQKAEELLLRSIDIEPHGFAYRSLANLYADRGDYTKAEATYQKALDAAKRLDTRISTLQDYRELKMLTGDYRTANEMANDINTLKDSLSTKVSGVEMQQQAFDRRVEHQALRESRRRAWLWSGVLLVLLTIGAVAYRYRKNQAEEQLRALQQQMAENAKAIAELRGEVRVERLEVRRRKLERMQEAAVTKMRADYARQLSHGCLLYEQLMAGGNVQRWYKRDFQDFEIYYCMRDIPFSVVLQENYSKLSPQQRFSLILSHMGKSDEDIQSLMGLSETAWRTMQSRMKKRLRQDS